MGRLLLLTAVLTFALAGVAQAMTQEEADLWGHGVARNDCNSGPGSWLCWEFNTAWAIDRCVDRSRWCSDVEYVQYDFTRPASAHCVTHTHWLVDGVGMTYHTHGCIGSVRSVRHLKVPA